MALGSKPAYRTHQLYNGNKWTIKISSIDEKYIVVFKVFELCEKACSERDKLFVPKRNSSNEYTVLRLKEVRETFAHLRHGKVSSERWATYELAEDARVNDPYFNDPFATADEIEVVKLEYTNGNPNR